MVTIFTCPKRFEGHAGRIQQNAILSWIRTGDNCEVVLIGDDDGVARFAQEHGLRHVPDVETNKSGVPLVRSIFQKGEQSASHPVVAYVNADIILGNQFVETVMKCAGCRNFLMSGQRTDLDFKELVNFEDKEWHSRIVSSAMTAGKKRGIAAIDYFAYRKGFWKDMPPFALGRFSWDNWLLYKARAMGAKLIDATSDVTAIHQNHDYQCGISTGGQVRDEEIEENRKYAGGRIYDLLDCTHGLHGNEIKPFRDAEHVWRRAWRLRERRPRVWGAMVSWKVRFLACWLFP